MMFDRKCSTGHVGHGHEGHSGNIYNRNNEIHDLWVNCSKEYNFQYEYNLISVCFTLTFLSSELGFLDFVTFKKLPNPSKLLTGRAPDLSLWDNPWQSCEMGAPIL